MGILFVCDPGGRRLICAWRDGAVRAQLVNRDGTSSSSYGYDRDGALRQVRIEGGSRPRTISYRSDLQGQLLYRAESDGNLSTAEPLTRTYRFGGRQMGLVSNDGTSNVDYAASIDARTAVPGNTVGGLANAAARSLLGGTDFGDNILAALPDIIGQTIGGMLAQGVAERSRGGSAGRSGKGGTRSTGVGSESGGASDSGGDAEIVVTAKGSNWGSVLDYIAVAPPTLEDQLNYAVRAGNAAVATMQRKQRIVEDLAAKQGGAQPGGTGYATIDLTDGTKNGAPTEGGWATTKSQITERRAYYHQAHAAGDIDDNVYAAISKSLDTNDVLLDQWKAQADAVVNQLAYDLGKTQYTLFTMTGAGGVVDLGYRATKGDLQWSDTAMLLPVFGKAFSMLGRAGEAANDGIKGFDGAYATNGELVQSIATRADKWGSRGLSGNGPVVGTYKHKYAERMLDRYQSMFGDRGLTPEARYVDGDVWESGLSTTGSIKLDVVEGPLTVPTAVWDYKFGNATLSQSRITQIRNGIPNGANVPILMVKP